MWTQRAGPDRYPRFRYKYKAIGSGTPEEREKRADQLRDILVEGLLWLSSPRDFNDPFDTTAQVIFEPASTEQKRQRIKRIIDQQSAKPWKKRKAMVDQEMARDPAEPLSEGQGIVFCQFR